ncbi:hypothetical protein ACHAWO_005269 [Cyclotella atomus]|uniref:Uncharacterized protein n=1 Tax=Cyclotella atomus TaxID=382360 RepID=A0ABD3NDP5_9STRA
MILSVLISVCLLSSCCLVNSLNIHQPQLRCVKSRYNTKCTKPCVLHAQASSDGYDEYESATYERRQFLKRSGAYLAGLGAPVFTGDAYADEIQQLSGDYDCLMDLPPVTSGCARLYLCRHGQTENNRLKIVQGARVDPPINANGFEQAKRLGMALSRLSYATNDGAAIPSIVAHSKMQRARMTAETLNNEASKSWSGTHQQLKLIGEVPSLGEVDFGSLEGTDSQKAKRQMMSTFASWSIGDVDKRLADGESGRDVVIRAVQALEELSKLAVSSSATGPPSILAVSHSTYLRVLISLVNDSPLAQSAFMKINNGSVSVVDVNINGKTRGVNLGSGLFGGGRGLGLLPRGKSGDVDIVMPEAFLIRTNEVRHLNGMEV